MHLLLEKRVLPLALVSAALGLGAASAPSASAHGIIEIRDETLSFRATDFVSRDALTVTQSGSQISIVNPTGFGGLDPGDCRPGRVDIETGYVIEALCPRSGIQNLRINSGEREDDIDVRVDLPTRVIAGGGADTVTTGASDDNISGGPGDDTIDPGSGSDKVDGGDGDEQLKLRDTLPDDVTCGPGNDAAEFDPFDQFAGDCERAPIVALGQREDEVAPHPTIRNAARQRGAGRLIVRATSDEPTTFVAQAAIVIGSQDFALRPGRGRLETTVGAVELQPRMSARTARIVRRALRSRRKVRLFITVVATDDHGNSSIANARTITLTRG